VVKGMFEAERAVGLFVMIGIDEVVVMEASEDIQMFDDLS
jgi:hypothetical protein